DERDVVAGGFSRLPTASVEEDRVAGRDGHASPFFPCFDVFLVDVGARLETRYASQPRDVDEHAARDDATSQRIDAELLAASFGHRFFQCVTVVNLAAVIAMAEGVNVSEARTMKRELLLLRRELR